MAKSVNTNNTIRERFLVRYGLFLEFKTKEDISYFYAEDKIVYLIDNSNNRFVVDFTLEKLEKLLEPKLFFRINRKFIINIAAIAKIKILANRTLQILLNTPSRIPMYVSRDRVPHFRNWIEH